MRRRDMDRPYGLAISAACRAYRRRCERSGVSAYDMPTLAQSHPVLALSLLRAASVFERLGYRSAALHNYPTLHAAQAELSRRARPLLDSYWQARDCGDAAATDAARAALVAEDTLTVPRF